MSNINIVLYHPQIPGNTGSIGRTCVALDARLILIKPLGFDLSEKALRRAGLDYWKYVDLVCYDSWEHFMLSEKPEVTDLYFLSRFAKKSYFKANLSGHPYLIFGSETKGLPQILKDEYPQHFFTMPMTSSHIRSLNLSNAATAVIYEAYRQQTLNLQDYT